MTIAETGFDLCRLEKSKNQKVIVPANFSGTPVLETSEQNISTTCYSDITLTVTL